MEKLSRVAAAAEGHCWPTRWAEELEIKRGGSLFMGLLRRHCCLTLNILEQIT